MEQSAADVNVTIAVTGRVSMRGQNIKTTTTPKYNKNDNDDILSNYAPPAHCAIRVSLSGKVDCVSWNGRHW